MDGNELFPTQEGTPQGGVISPLLANIALHGMEEALEEFAKNPPKELKKAFGIHGTRGRSSSLKLVRYADDVVVLHQNLEIVLKSKEILEAWLSDIGLTFKPEKTNIAHTLHSHNREKPGFNFLGFRIYQPEVSKYKSGKTQKGYVTHTIPQNEKVAEHYEDLRRIVNSMKSAPQWALIEKLNPVIRGWCNYYKPGVSKRIFNKLDFLLINKLIRWGYRRHPKKGKYEVNDKYWKTEGGDDWVFATKEGAKLYKHSKTKIKRHTIVKDGASP